MMKRRHSLNSPTPTSLNNPRNPVTGVKSSPVIRLLNRKSFNSLNSGMLIGSQRLFRSAYQDTAHGMSEQMMSLDVYHSLISLKTRGKYGGQMKPNLGGSV